MAQTKDPISNTVSLASAINDFAYSVVFWPPSLLGLPVPPKLPSIGRVEAEINPFS